MELYNKLGKELFEYCQEFHVPHEYVFEILNDQKVVPMIRGKATEYNAYTKLKEILSEREWSVDKLNLNAQPNSYDEDVSITHRRSGIIIKVECKSAVRASMKSGKKARNVKVPHCTIKCHKSRSNKQKVETNDRYEVESFDIVLSNLSNAIIKSATIGAHFELIDDDPEIVDILSRYYSVKPNFEALEDATIEDWRYALSVDIAVDGFLPRTPPVLLQNDPNWCHINDIETGLLRVVEMKIEERKNEKSRRS